MLVFDRKGSGTPLVLLHGTNSSRSIWKPLLPQLSGRREVFSVDLPALWLHSAISRIESGQHPTTVQTLRRLAEALGTHLVVGFVDEIADLGDTSSIDLVAADLVAVG